MPNDNSGITNTDTSRQFELRFDPPVGDESYLKVMNLMEASHMMNLFYNNYCEKDVDPTPAEDFLNWKNRQVQNANDSGYLTGIFWAALILLVSGAVSWFRTGNLLLLVFSGGGFLIGVVHWLFSSSKYTPEIWARFVHDFWRVRLELVIIPTNREELNKQVEVRLVALAQNVIASQQECNYDAERIAKDRFDILHTSLQSFGLVKPDWKHYYDLARQRQASQSKETEAASKTENLAKGPIELADIQTGGRLSP